MENVYHRQTKAHDAHRGLRLSVISPYFQRKDLEEDRQTGRDIPISTLMTNMIMERYQLNSVVGYLADSTGTYTGGYSATFSVTPTDTDSVVAANAQAAMTASLAAQSIPAPDVYTWLMQGMTATASQITAALASYTPPLPTRTISTPTRALNTAYTPSSTLPTLVIMSVEIDASLSLSGGTKGTVTLLASNNSFSTSTTESVGVNGNTGTLTIGLNTVGAGGGVVMGYVPAGYAYKAVTASSTGTATFSVLATTEIVGI